MVTRDEVADPIRARILAGDLMPGDRVPSVRDLARETGASRVTASHALRLLAAEGLITLQEKRPGVVRHSNDRDRSDRARIAQTRANLAAIHADVQAAQRDLGAIAAKVASALADLD